MCRSFESVYSSYENSNLQSTVSLCLPQKTEGWALGMELRARSAASQAVIWREHQTVAPSAQAPASVAAHCSQVVRFPLLSPQEGTRGHHLTPTAYTLPGHFLPPCVCVKADEEHGVYRSDQELGLLQPPWAQTSAPAGTTVGPVYAPHVTFYAPGSGRVISCSDAPGNPGTAS